MNAERKKELQRAIAGAVVTIIVAPVVTTRARIAGPLVVAAV